ncbi:MAG TPA: hypothetical protein VFJ57_03610 [Solirubrobacterales bacterium]|nr:hypothetical protein [Solirubrobacterales bacterium]
MPPSDEAEALRGLSRRLLGVAAVLGLLLIAVVANHWLHDGDEVINPFNPISAAASQTAAAGGYTADTAVAYTVEDGPPVKASGTAEYNAETGRARADISVPTPAGTVDVESVGDSSHVYIRSAAFAGQLPDGAEWIGIEPLLGQTSPGLAGSDGAKQQLQMLRAVADVEKVGSEAIGGVVTQRYHGTIYIDRVADYFAEKGAAPLADEYRKLAKLMPDPIPVEVWIGPDGTVREMRIISKLPSEDGRPGVTMDMRITIDELGVKPDIDLPDPGSVYDATPLLREQLSQISA